MKRKQKLYIVLLVVGLCLVAAALALRDYGLSDSAGGMLTGVGSGLIGLSISQLLLFRQEYKNPALARQNEISRTKHRIAEPCQSSGRGHPAMDRYGGGLAGNRSGCAVVGSAADNRCFCGEEYSGVVFAAQVSTGNVGLYL